jgi:ribonucleotide reductase beta subunit family protein with ferritin-like domain
MHAAFMCLYIEFYADRRLGALKQPRMYQVTNPFPWMTSISL